MSKPASVRVVGTRRVTSVDDVDLMNADFMLGDDGSFLVSDAAEIASDDAESIAAKVRERRGLAEDLVDKLSPSAYALYLAMTDALARDPNVLRRLDELEPAHLMVVVRVAGTMWEIAASAAFDAFAATMAADRLSAPVAARGVAPEYSHAVRRVRTSSALHNARTMHVPVMYAEDTELPADVAAFADASVDLRVVNPRFFDLAVTREFEAQGDAGWTTDIDLEIVYPDIIDSVCMRAGRVEQVVPMLRAVLTAREVEEQRRVEEAEVKTTKTTAKGYVPDVLTPTSPTVADLSGYGAAQVWAQQLADDVALYRAGELAWADVDGGCLLHGPPGTGKTLFAGALAASCGLPFIPSSFAQWQGARGGHLGDVVNAMLALFRTAAENAPCVVFIDEIDSVPRRGSSREFDDYWAPITNALLECLDGSTRREGVIVVAACNDASRLDPAMLRSGRLDRRFEIGLPDETALLGIMRHHLPDASPDDLAPAATVLAGMTSGADVARIAREARRTARRGKRPVTAADMLAIALPPDTRPVADRRLVAVHEAGHAIANMFHGRVPDALTIASSAGTHGHVRTPHRENMGRPAEIEREIVEALAGRAAEEVVLGEPSAGARMDLEEATRLVVLAVGRCGMGGRLVVEDHVDVTVVEVRLRDLYGRALRLVGEHRVALEALADLALERRVLGRAALIEFAAEHGLGEVS